MDIYIKKLVEYAVAKGFIAEADKAWAVNSLLWVLDLESYDDTVAGEVSDKIEDILDALTKDAVSRGVIDDGIAAYDLFTAKLMGMITPKPSEVIAKFNALYDEDPKKATDWYYTFSGDTNYINRSRIAKDVKWTADSDYGEIDITINLSKPEKDPKAIAAAKNKPQSGYPKCMLCRECEGFAGNLNFPARENHRILPLHIDGGDWFMQYSPYVYYNEHCIALNAKHVPMVIDRSAFRKLLDFVTLFPHYFIGSNADLPIVGGSILAHEHFQGGNYEFAMAKAEIETELQFVGFDNVKAGIVRWPMSVIRLSSDDTDALVDLADKILTKWRAYTDESAFIFAETEGTPHSTVTPIARMRDGKFELDLVLRNNITTEEHPFGVYHPHAELHHIKKENIGLIEVMGLAVLPARLKEELAVLAEKMVNGEDLLADERTAKHAEWAEEIKKKYPALCAENADTILKKEVGIVFAKVLEHAGVYARNEDGKAAFLRFIAHVNAK